MRVKKMNIRNLLFNVALMAALLMGLSVGLAGLTQAAPVQAERASVSDAAGGRGPGATLPASLPPNRPLLQASPVLTITKRVSPAAVAPGGPLTYTLSFANQGTITATGVIITDAVPITVTNLAVNSSGVTITQTNAGVLTYTWDVQDLAPGQAGVITITGVVSPGLEGGLSFTNTAIITTTTGDTNTVGGASEAGVTILNVAPVAAGDSQSTNEDTTLSLTVLGNDTDPNGDSLIVAGVDAPANGTATISGVTVVYTPTLNFNGTDTFSYTASDGALTDTATITVTVDPVNDAPALDPIGAQVVNEGALIGFTATATDVDVADTLSFSFSNVPGGASTGGASFSWTPTETQGPGVYTMTVTVSDNGSPVLTDSETISITVNEVNIAPVLAPIGNRTVNEESLLSFTASATDADRPPNTLTFSLAAGTPTGANITGGGLFTWTPTEAQGPGVYPVTIIVSDGGSPVLTDSETISVTVNEINKAPVLAPIGNRTVDEESLLSFTVSVTDVDLPANGLTYGLVNPPSGATIGSGSGIFSWTPTEAQGPGVYPVTFVVTDTGSPALTDSETINITVNAVANLSIGKTSLPGSIVAGSGTTLNYVLTIRNDGPSAATGVVVTDTLPVGVSFDSANFDGGSCSEDGGTVTCTRSAISRNQSVLASIDVTVDSATSGTITNWAGVTSTVIDRNAANNTAPANTTVNTEADLTVDKRAAPEPVLLRTPLTYSLTITNFGPSDATDVTVTDTLPGNVQFNRASPGCAYGSGQVVCNLGGLVTSASTGVTIVVTPTATGSLNNSALVGSPVTDPDTGNNSDGASTTVNPRAELALSITDFPDPIVAGNSLTYTLTVANSGPSAATGVVLTDTLPSGVIFMSATPSQGNCADTGDIVCNLNTIAGGGNVVVTLVVSLPTSIVGNISNLALVAGQEADTVSANNSDSETTTVTAFIPDVRLVYLPLIYKSPPTYLYVYNENTGGNVLFNVLGTSVSCTVPNNDTKYCGSFPPGYYQVQIFSVCGDSTFTVLYKSGNQTTTVFCN